MSQVQIVAPIYINQIWDKVEPFLEAGLARSGHEFTTEHLKMYLTEGRQDLLIAVDENNEIHGAACIQWNNFPNDRVAFITSIGGKMIANKDIWAQFEAWVKQNGGTLIRGAAFESVARLWRRAFGVQSRYIIVEKRV
jgi:hypothetical protein